MVKENSPKWALNKNCPYLRIPLCYFRQFGDVMSLMRSFSRQNFIENIRKVPITSLLYCLYTVH